MNDSISTDSNSIEECRGPGCIEKGIGTTQRSIAGVVIVSIFFSTKSRYLNEIKAENEYYGSIIVLAKPSDGDGDWDICAHRGSQTCVNKHGAIICLRWMHVTAYRA
jgi:hypothetical protein